MLVPCSFTERDMYPDRYFRVVREMKEYRACENWPESPPYLEVADDIENPDGEVVAMMLKHSPHPADDYEGARLCLWKDKVWLAKEVGLGHDFGEHGATFRI